MNKTQKKKLTTLGICVAVLAVLCVVFVVVKQRATAYEEKESEDSSETVFDITADKIDEITYTTSDGTELQFARDDDGNWTDQSDGTVLDQTKVGTLASSFTGVSLTQKIEDVSDLSEYGLDNPVYTCSFTDSDGNTTKFYLGDTNDTASVIYLYIDGDTSTVYAVSTSITSQIESKTSMDDYLPDSTADSAADSTVSADSSVSEASSEASSTAS